MNDLTTLISQIKDHEIRISNLEKGLNTSKPKVLAESKNKELTISELIKDKSFNSGQKKVAAIVGFCEKILKFEQIDENKIKDNWVRGKFDGKYRSNLIERAVHDGLIRDLGNGTYDLSQTGERFFEKLLSENDGQNQN